MQKEAVLTGSFFFLCTSLLVETLLKTLLSSDDVISDLDYFFC